MQYQIKCPSCNTILQIEQKYLGSQIQCPTCQSSFATQRPTQSQPPSPQPPAPQPAAPQQTPLQSQPAPSAQRGPVEFNEDNIQLIEKATNIGNDAEKAVLAGLIPILGLVFILRLVQWYSIKSDVEQNQAIEPAIRDKFMKGKVRLWVAVLLWPVLIVFIMVFVLIAGGL